MNRDKDANRVIYMYMNIKTIFLILVIIVVVGLCILFLNLTLKPEVEKYAREEAPEYGKFAALEQGDVYYELAGPEDGPPVILVHGSIVYNISWDKNFYELANAGFRVVRFDLYGRGNSSRPNIAYTATVYLNQIKQLLDYVEFTKNVHLIGLSMGGALVTMFAEQYPQVVNSVILVDPITPQFWKSTSGKKIIQRSIERFQKILGKKTEVQEKRLQIVGPLLKKMRNQFKYKGVGRSIYSGIKHLKKVDLSTAYQKLGTRKNPTLLIWGELDDVIPVSESSDVLKLVPQTEFHPVKSAGHLVQYEKPEEVNRLLIDFIKRHSADSSS